MKKIFYTILIASCAVLTACKGSNSKTGGDVADSGSAGSSGPADSVGVISPGNPAGGSASRSDTSTIQSNRGSAEPTADTGRRLRP
jgi:hypothetical protein